MNLNRTFGLRVEKFAVSKCINVSWDQIPSGACVVRYNVTLKDVSEAYLSSEVSYNNKNVEICNRPGFDRVYYVQLIVSFRGQTNDVTVSLPRERVPSQSGTSFYSCK